MAGSDHEDTFGVTTTEDYGEIVVDVWSHAESAGRVDGSGYHVRARQVYWDKSFPACRVKGPHRAECLLNPNHGGEFHYGNGTDQWGPPSATIWKMK